MHKITLVFLILVIFMGCEKDQALTFDAFYDANDVRFVSITVDKTDFLEGDEPIIINGFARDEIRREIPNVRIRYIVDGDTLSSNKFTPTRTGKHRIRAITNNGIRSNEVTVNAIMFKDINSLTLQYNETPFLTTAPWSILSGIRPLANGEIDLSYSNQLNALINDEPTPLQTPIHFDTPGEYIVKIKLQNLVSNSITISVREDKASEIIEIPLIFHFYEYSLLADLNTVQEAVDGVNQLFNNMTISQEDIIEKGENPNKVNTYVRFYLAETAPDGTPLVTPGIDIIEEGTRNDVSTDDLDIIADQTFWDPNHYLNIWVASGDWRNGKTWNSPGFGSYPILLKESLPGLTTLEEEPSEPIRNVLYMNGNLDVHILAHEIGHNFSLFHNFEFGCTMQGDHVPDTNAYPRNGIDDDAKQIINHGCNSSIFSKNNIMDYGGTCTTLTFDQRERMRFVLEHALFFPTPTNRQKPIREGLISNPKSVHEMVY